MKKLTKIQIDVIAGSLYWMTVLGIFTAPEPYALYLCFLLIPQIVYAWKKL
tara:strand:- start:630 stop:782 length:153 start_codon:yes stop_codon:yes gene_type:complete